jgi:DNA adenine methylase
MGEFNVPIGTRTGAYFSKVELLTCSAMLKETELLVADFAETLKHVRAADFVYLDPPFAVDSRRVFREYGARCFSTSDMVRLAENLKRIDHSGADFLVSYADSKEARAITREWNATRLPIRRHVAGFSGSRRRAYEWLISNMDLKEILRQRS